MEAEEASSQFEANNNSVASYDAKLAKKKTNMPVTERNLRVRAANRNWDHWCQSFLQGVEALGRIF